MLSNRFFLCGWGRFRGRKPSSTKEPHSPLCMEASNCFLGKHWYLFFFACFPPLCVSEKTAATRWEIHTSLHLFIGFCRGPNVYPRFLLPPSPTPPFSRSGIFIQALSFLCSNSPRWLFCVLLLSPCSTSALGRVEPTARQDSDAPVSLSNR